MNFKSLRVFVLAMVFAVGGWAAAQGQTIKIGVIEPYSGPIAAIGTEALQAMELAADQINQRGGVQINLVGMDNAMKAEQTIQQLKKAIDEGFRFVSQGVGSNHALNIIKYLDRHNARNPSQSVLYFNTAAVTTAFTNELCSFWHFRFDANVDMKVAGLATQMGRDMSIKKVYMLNQNYAFGKSVQAAGLKMIKERTHAQVVGDDLIVPFGKTQDFTPYVAKIKASGADTVLTGNWGPDLARFVQAVGQAGLDVQFYTLYAGIPSSVFAYGKENGEKVHIKQVSEQHMNDESRAAVKKFAAANLAKYQRTWYADRYRYAMEMIAAAAKKAGSNDPVKVARALEGLTYPGGQGDMQMRATDHQIQLPMVVSTIDLNAPDKMIYDGKPVGVGWKTDGWVSREELTLPTTCKMKRP